AHHAVRAVTLARMLAISWAALVAAPIARGAHCCGARERASSLVTPESPRLVAVARALHGALPRVLVRVGGAVGRVLRIPAERRRARRARAALARELPVVVDLLGVAVGAGCTPYLAIGITEAWGPPRFSATSRAVMHACELGLPFGGALDDAARVSPLLRPLVD